MLVYNNIKYKLCLLDTNSLSEIIKNHNNIRDNFFKKYWIKNYIPCITIWSILELRNSKNRKLYNEFLEIFSIIPFCLLKPYSVLLDEERNNYPIEQKIDPILFTFSILSSVKLNKFFKKLFRQRIIKRAEYNWSFKWRKEVLDDILSLKDNFRSAGKNYNANDARRFIKHGIPHYLSSRYPKWVESKIRNSEKIHIDCFKSIKINFYTVFYRFYGEKRKSEIQDVFDLLISSALPYVDATIIEKFQAEILKKIKRRDNFLNHLEVLTLKELM